MKKSLIFIVILAIIVVSAWLIYKEGSLAVNPKDTTSKIFVIKPGESVDSIARNLANEGLIRNRVIFYMVVKKEGFEKNIQAGDFRLSPSMDLYTVAETLTHGTLDNWTTIIEGLRKEEIAQIISKDFDIPEVEFIKQAPEGYLFPDTYLIPSEATVEQVISIMTNNFDSKYTPDIQAKADKLGLSKEQVVILASIVEKEALTKDRIEIASILLRRFKDDYPLQADATVQYALGYQTATKKWWKGAVTLDDLKIESPYNTYVNEGLPAGPICNPGFASIEAVVNADPSTPYYFYLHDINGNTYYARTYEEHQANIKKYLQ